MEKDHLEQLLSKYLSGKCTREESIEVEKWYASFEKDPGLINGLTESERMALEYKMLQRIDDKISSYEQKTVVQHRATGIPVAENKVRRMYSYWYRIAAVLVGLLALAIIGYQSIGPNTVVYNTAYGQTNNIQLPDGSTVVLNGNSTLRYVDNWTEDGIREVHLDGEAFFSVAPTRTKQKFIVTVSETMNVEVLGTKFNVSKRKSGTRVVLNSGKILLNLKEPEGVEPVAMSPGDLVEFNGENAVDYVKKKVNVEIYSAWKNHKFIFDNTTLKQVLTMLEENYGLKGNISDQELLDMKVSGTIPAENVESLLTNISITYGIDIERTDDFIVITKASRRN